MIEGNIARPSDTAGVAGDYWVVAVDKFMSGWGQAKGGKSAVIIHCHDDEQAHECEKALSYDKNMKHVKTCYGTKPRVNNAAHVQELDFLKCPLWNKEYLSNHNTEVTDMNESKTNKNMKKNVVKLNENALRNIVAESVKKVLKEGVGTPKLTMAYKNLVDCIYTIVLERAKISMGQNGLETTIDAVDNMETFKQDVKEYTEKYIYPQINKIYDTMISNYDMLGGMDYAKENGEGIGDRNWK